MAIVTLIVNKGDKKLDSLKKTIKEFWVKNKYNMCILGGMIVFSLIICSNFLRTHFALDTYCVYAHDTKVQITHFLVSNRIFSALIRWIYMVFNIPFFTGMRILMLSGVVFLALSWFILYKFVINMQKKENVIFYNILITGICFLIIFNFCTVESLLFWESGVMCFGILCTIIAACMFNSNIKLRKIFSFFILLIGSTCYQGSITIYIPLTLVLLAYKEKNSIKKIFIDTLKVCAIYIIVMVINLLATKFFSIILNDEFRKMQMLTFAEMFQTIGRFSSVMVLQTFGIGKKYWYLFALLFITLIFIFHILKTKKIKFVVYEYFILIISCIIIPILPLLATQIDRQYLETRMAMSFGSSLGILLLFLIIVVQVYKEKISKYLVVIFTFIMVMFNSIYYIKASSENLATNYLDRNIAKSIIEEIYNYQDKTGIKIENIGVTLDKNPSTYYNGQPAYSAINTRSMVVDWAAIETIELYSGEHFNQISVPDNYKKDFSQKNWDFFNKDQLIFEGNNLYICMY